MKKKAARIKRGIPVRSGRPTNKQIAEKRGKAFALLYEKHLDRLHRASGNTPLQESILMLSELGKDIAYNNKSKRAVVDDIAAFAALIRQRRQGSLFVSNNVYYHERLFVKRRLKEAIASKAAELIEAGASIACSAGTTAALCARRIIESGKYVNILTTNIGISDVGIAHADIELTGGEYDPIYHACTGDRTIGAFKEVRCRWALMGVSGIDEHGGLYVNDPREPRIRNAIIESTTERFLVVADATKLAQRDPRQFETIRGLIGRHPVTLVTNVPDEQELKGQASKARDVLDKLRNLADDSDGRFRIVLAD